MPAGKVCSAHAVLTPLARLPPAPVCLQDWDAQQKAKRERILAGWKPDDDDDEEKEDSGGKKERARPGQALGLG